MAASDVTGVLDEDHRELRALFSRWYRTPDFAGQQEIVRRAVATELRHALVVRNHLKPALQEAAADVAEDLLLLQNHVEAVMNHLDEASRNDVNYHLLVIRLINDLRFQMHREETDVFPRIRAALSEEVHASLADRLEESKRDAPGWPEGRSDDAPPFSDQADRSVPLVERVTAWLADDTTDRGD